MRRMFVGIAVVAAVAMLAPARVAQAQVNNGSDVFGFYYGYYLPHAQQQAMITTPLDTINQNIAQRQYAAATDRTALYDPISPYGDVDEDPTNRFGRRGGGGGGGGAGLPMQPRGFALTSTNVHTNGNGPAGFYNRTARYFPGLKQARGPNQNLARIRGGRGGGGMGMPSMGGGMGMPGPR